VWHAQTRECLEVIQGDGDVRAIAAGFKEYPWRFVSQGLEGVIQAQKTGEPVAWFNEAIDLISSSASVRFWAGNVRNHLYILMLEGKELEG
jgi:hypothetical protein